MTVHPRVAVTRNGPYEVTGDLPITPKRVVTSDVGEPLTWATAAGLPHGTPTLLCRCGASKTKPFCDNSHLRVGFDGQETASNERFFEREKTYEGNGITVHRVGALCAHASFCANRTTDWYQLLADTADVNVRAEVIAMIEHCPSGGLVYEIDGQIIEPDLPKAVSPVEDGPLWVTGNVEIMGSDRTPYEIRNRVALCRCGQSKNKPFCDGTHLEIEFEAKNQADEVTIGFPTRTEDATRGPYRHLVAGVRTETGAETYAVAAMIARAASAQVSMVHAGGDDNEAGRVLAEAIDRAKAAGIDPEMLSVELRTESPASALTLAAEDADAGLIVIGRGGERLARLVRQILHRSPCDVLVVAPRVSEPFADYRRILVATDGSATADRAAGRGYELARALGASIDLVFVGHPATGEMITSDTMSVCGSDVPTEVHLLEGNPAKRILETAAAIEADLIVVGNKGIGKPRMTPGDSVPGAVVTRAHRDVLLCRTVHQRESELAPGSGGVIERNGQQMAAFVDESGELHLMSARCPHQGCVVAWNPSNKSFDCPCHGSRFGPLGEVVDGPATKPLRPA